MTKRVVVRVAARGYVDGRYIGEEKEVIEAVDPSGRGKRGRSKPSNRTAKNDNIGNSADNRGNRVGGRGKKRGEPRVAGTASGEARKPRGPRASGTGQAAGSRQVQRRGANPRVVDGNAAPIPGAGTYAPPRGRQPRGRVDRQERDSRAGQHVVPGVSDGNAILGEQGAAHQNAHQNARRNRGGKKTPFRVAAQGAIGNQPRALISEVAETRRWGDEAKSGQFAEALAKESVVKRERLHKVLAQSGHGSRRDMEIMISSGRVMVNGIVATTGTSVSAQDMVMIDRHPVKLKFGEELPRVMLYHKPDGEIVTTNDPGNRITVFDNLPRVENGKWMAIGRLDINTSGLLIFTTSGELANRLMHPRYEVEREYAVRVLGELTEEQTQRLLDGVSIATEADDDDDELQADERPAKFDVIEKRGGEGTNQWYHVVIKEGRNREVRKMFEAVGLTVSRLIRVRFGKIGLPPRLVRGRMMEFDASQVRAVLKWVGMDVEGHIGALPTNNADGRRTEAPSRDGAKTSGRRNKSERVERVEHVEPADAPRIAPTRAQRTLPLVDTDNEIEGITNDAPGLVETDGMEVGNAAIGEMTAMPRDNRNAPRRGRRGRGLRRGDAPRTDRHRVVADGVSGDAIPVESNIADTLTGDGNAVVVNTGERPPRAPRREPRGRRNQFRRERTTPTAPGMNANAISTDTLPHQNDPSLVTPSSSGDGADIDDNIGNRIAPSGNDNIGNMSRARPRNAEPRGQRNLRGRRKPRSGGGNSDDGAGNAENSGNS